MESNINKEETIEILNFIRNNLNDSLSNETQIIRYLKDNYTITDSCAKTFVNVIKAEKQL